MLEGWLPIIVLFILSACLIVLMARYTRNQIVFSLSALLGCVCLGTILYSIFMVGGWDGMAIGFYAIAAFLGLSIGTAISPFIKKKTGVGQMIALLTAIGDAIAAVAVSFLKERKK